MIWFDIKKLEQRLTSGALTNQEAFCYLLANLILYSITPYLSNHDHSSWWLSAEAGLAVCITIIGTKQVFDINTSGDDKDFLQRFLSVSFVITIRLLVFVCILSIPLAIIQLIAQDLLEVDILASKEFDIAITVGAEIIFYFMLIASFKRIAFHSN